MALTYDAEEIKRRREARQKLQESYSPTVTTAPVENQGVEMDYGQMLKPSFWSKGDVWKTVGKDIGTELVQSVWEIPASAIRGLGTGPGAIYEQITGKEANILPKGIGKDEWLKIGNVGAPKSGMDALDKMLGIAMLPMPGAGKAIGGALTKAPGTKQAIKGVSEFYTKKLASTSDDVLTKGIQTLEQLKPLTKEGKIAKEKFKLKTASKQIELTKKLEVIETETKDIFKNLSTDAKANIDSVITGRALPEAYADTAKELGLPVVKVGKKMEAAINKYKTVAKEEKDLLLESGNLTPLQIEDRAFLEMKEVTGKTTEQLKNILNKSGDRKPFDPTYFPIKIQKYLSSKEGLSKLGGQLGIKTPSFLKPATGKGVLHKGRVEAESALVNHRFEVAAFQAQKELFDSVLNTFKGVPGKGTVEYVPKDALGKALPGYERSYVNPSIIGELDKLAKRGAVMDNYWKDFVLKGIDMPIKLWKAGVLATRPAWMAINIIGNITLNIVGGVSPKTYAKVFQKEYKDLAKTGLRDIPKSTLTKEEASVMGEGVLRKTEETIYKPNQSVEDYFRWVHFIDKAEKSAVTELKATGTKFDKDKVFDLIKRSDDIQGGALASTNKYLFDYSALNSFERSTMKRLMPFYTWIKNINRLSAQTVIEKPWVAARLKTFYDAMGSETKDDEGLPEYLRGSIKLDIGLNDEGKVVTLKEDKNATPMYWNWKYMFPFFDVGKFSPMAILSSATPWIKVPVERTAGKRIFSEGDPKEFTAPSLVEGEDVPERPTGLKKLWEPDIEYEEHLTYGKRKVESARPSILRHVAEQTSVIRFLEDMITPYARYSATGEVIKDKKGEPLYKKPRSLSALRYLTGLGFSPYDRK